MTVRLDGEIVRLEGVCRVEEAERLTALLQAAPRTVDLGACEALHGAVAQVVLAFAPPLEGRPAGAFLREHLAPALGLGGNTGPARDNGRLGRYGHGRTAGGGPGGEGARD